VGKNSRGKILDFKDYEEFTESTDISNQSLQFYLDGMSEEGGELSGIFKRVRRGDFGPIAQEMIEAPNGVLKVLENFPEVKKVVISEIGDRHWYTTRFLNKIKVGWNDVMDYNKVKIVKREKDGTIMGHGEDRS